MALSAIFGERYLSKAGGVYDSEEEAREVARRIGDRTSVRDEQVKVVNPHDRQVGRKLEPESTGIAYTLVKSHVTLGIIGAVVGLLVGLLLVSFGGQMFATSPSYTTIVAAAVGAIAGLLLGGLASIRPDHDLLITEVQRAAKQGRWAVVVHARDEDEKRAVEAVLKERAEDVKKTL